MEKYGENFEYQKRECLRRARSVEYIAANDARVLKRERLEILKGLMQVKDILLIGPSGEILLSTSVSLEGTGENEDVMEQLREKQTDADRENGKETPGGSGRTHRDLRINRNIFMPLPLLIRMT